ncbi:hypothetical protein PC9H_000104 [Pleurotus ostreatus]|uniref:Uncharacterized protein n=1 Tax=Pleurotus ostreatus TaxID=5322 RepID=A0A8H7A0H8_PLEOS|nr:uncharacterized protein PC9H_000104 [Pleurotus ostreatus]KAF7439768.1 hypothetical protein PC9H_000104 [Pleurotus ostreatus]
MHASSEALDTDRRIVDYPMLCGGRGISLDQGCPTKNLDFFVLFQSKHTLRAEQLINLHKKHSQTYTVPPVHIIPSDGLHSSLIAISRCYRALVNASDLDGDEDATAWMTPVVDEGAIVGETRRKKKTSAKSSHNCADPLLAYDDGRVDGVRRRKTSACQPRWRVVE